jgi:hypothetical protein
MIGPDPSFPATLRLPYRQESGVAEGLTQVDMDCVNFVNLFRLATIKMNGESA